MLCKAHSCHHSVWFVVTDRLLLANLKGHVSTEAEHLFIGWLMCGGAVLPCRQ